MVRLKVSLKIAHSLNSSLFQFQYGAIKRLDIVREPSPITDFNSNMVRLKEALVFTDSKVSDKFQFQYGAIKSGRFHLRPVRTERFQFQYGAIKSNKNFQTYYKIKLISIPIWCD